MKHRNFWFLGIITAISFTFCSSVIAQNKQPDQGKALFEAKCGKCHGLSKSLSKTKDFEGWNSTVQRMAKKSGGDISADDAKTIAEYLSNRKQ